jgi:hypothetical protein
MDCNDSANGEGRDGEKVKQAQNGRPEKQYQDKRGESMSAVAPKHFHGDVLNRLAQTAEIEIDAPRPETALIQPRTIWVVVVGDHAFVRSWKGNAGRWFQEVRAHAKAIVYLDGHPIPVRAFPVSDEATIAQVSDAYRRKYYEDPFMSSMLREEILPSTLRLEPQ